MASCSLCQSFEIVLFFKVSFSFLKRASCFSLVHFSFQPPNTEITAQLQRKEFLPRHVCIGEQSLFLECFCLFWSLYPKVLSTEIKCLYWEVPRREYCFLSGREEGRVKIFLLEVSDQNLNLRAQHLSQGQVANLRSSHLNLNSQSPQVWRPVYTFLTSLHRQTYCLCFSIPPQGNHSPPPQNLTPHLPTNVMTKNVTLCLIPSSPGGPDPLPNDKLRFFRHLITL